jgi:hypothetical protein
VGKAKTRAVLDEEFDQASVVRKDIDGPGIDLGKDTLMEILDLVAHA